jgi:hypothetical protein
MDRDATAGESGGGAAGSGIDSAAIARLPAFGRRRSSVATAVTHLSSASLRIVVFRLYRRFVPGLFKEEMM